MWSNNSRPATLCDVLIVDDDVVLSDMMAAFLGRNGLEVRTAVSGAAALELIEKVEPRVGVFDYELPDGTGLHLAQTMRQQLPGMAIILMSASVNDVDRSGFGGTGIKVFVNKPVPPGALLQAVRQLIGQRR